LATQGQLVSGQKRNQVFCFEDADPRAEVLADQCKLVLNLQMCLNGDKVVDIDLADFKLMVQAGPLFAVLGVVAMDDPNLTPAAGKYTLLKEPNLKQD
jgi:vacuolar protein sorting-associated protein 13A/C